MGEPIRWSVATVVMALTPTVAILVWWPLGVLGMWGAYVVLLAVALAVSVLLLRRRRSALSRSVGAGVAAGLGSIASVYVVLVPALALGTVLGGGSW